MVIVQGVFRVDPAERDAYLAETAANVRVSRAEPGCLEYCFAADPIEPDRVVLTERWESQESLDAHLARLTRDRADAADAGAAPGVTVLSREVEFFRVESVQPPG